MAVVHSNKRAVTQIILAALLLGALQTFAGPNLVCDDTVYDFGSRRNTEVVKHDFQLRNEGDETLRISSVRTSCGCTVAELDTRRIDPGKGVALHAEFRLQGRKGHQSKTIYIHSNDPEQPLLRLAMRGEARSVVDVVPRHLSFGRISGGRSETRLIRVTVHEPIAIELRDIRDTEDAFNISFRSDTGKPNTKTIVVSTKKDLAPGVYRGTVELAEDGADDILTSVGVYVRILDKLTVMPTEIVVPLGDEDVQRNVIITEGKVEKFEIRGVKPPVRKIKTDIKPVGDRGYLIRVSGIDGTPELDGKVLTIETDVEDMKNITIPFRVVEK